MLFVNQNIICKTNLQNQKSPGVFRSQNVFDCFGLVKLAEAEDVCHEVLAKKKQCSRSSLGQAEFVQRDLQHLAVW